jgi:thymidylate synthase
LNGLLKNTMNNLDKTYTALLQDILDNGVEKKDRTGTGTISVFGRQIRHDMKEGFPLLTTKKMHWKSIVTELLWFLRGDTNIKYLIDNDCHIWDGDCYQSYVKNRKHSIRTEGDRSEIAIQSLEKQLILSQEEFIEKIKTDDEFAKKWGNLGPIYGKQWRHWENEVVNYSGMKYSREPVDQIANLISELKTNPDSRRLMVNAWNVGELSTMILPPCHYGFQVYTRELSLDERMQIWQNQQDGRGEFIMECLDVIPTRAISLMWNQRSVDTFLGLPFNIASYGLLLEIIAREVNMIPDELIGNLGDVHLYSNHIKQAKEQIGHELTAEERYHLWFDLNYETGMERHYDPERLPDYDNDYWQPTPTRSRHPFSLPTVSINTEFWQTESGECGVGPLKTNLQGFEIDDFQLANYQSHPAIKAPLSN